MVDVQCASKAFLQASEALNFIKFLKPPASRPIVELATACSCCPEAFAAAALAAVFGLFFFTGILKLRCAQKE